MLIGEEVLFGLGQQVPHRGGGSWRYSPECNDEIYGGTCQPTELFGLGQVAGLDMGSLLATGAGAVLIGVSFAIKGDVKDIVRGLGVVVGGLGLGKIVSGLIAK